MPCNCCKWIWERALRSNKAAFSGTVGSVNSSVLPSLMTRLNHSCHTYYRILTDWLIGAKLWQILHICTREVKAWHEHDNHKGGKHNWQMAIDSGRRKGQLKTLLTPEGTVWEASGMSGVYYFGKEIQSSQWKNGEARCQGEKGNVGLAGWLCLKTEVGLMEKCSSPAVEMSCKLGLLPDVPVEQVTLICSGI